MKTLFSSLKITISFCIILFVGYVLVLNAFAWVVSPNQGNAEVLRLNGKVVGASNVGQQFTQNIYFWGRPSAVDYNGSGSGGSNKSAMNTEYIQDVNDRIDLFLKEHPYLDRKALPSELVTASASGLDPHISPKAADVQIIRVAQARGLSVDHVTEIVNNNTVYPIVGQPYINVLKINIALDNEKNN